VRPILLASLLILLLACDKKQEAPLTTSDAGGKMAVVDRALANGQGGMAEQGKVALVAQQCTLACGARPGIDPGTCTQACTKTCGAEKDVAAIDACASKVAAEQPSL
jgi:hypothetical protein